MNKQLEVSDVYVSKEISNANFSPLNQYKKMFTVIYSFHVKTEQLEQFEKAWKDLTLLIIKYEGSLGSRLHKKDESEYIGYAQWPNRQMWENSGKKIPKESKFIWKEMRGACDKIETLFQLEVVEDLLKKE